jgi:choline monooxygenase
MLVVELPKVAYRPISRGGVVNMNSIDWTAATAWSGTRRSLPSATGLHPGAYTDPAFFAVERQRVFERSWVAVGLAAEVAEPGRMLVRQVGGVSVLVTRGDDGELRGFLNSCRHRGTELANSDCDVAGTIRCPYHRWGYAVDGRLVATPRFDEVPRDDFDPAEHSLVEVRVGTWGVLLFACLEPTTPSLNDWLGDLPERLAGYGLDDWRVEDQMELVIDANWKLISENFQEYYHLSWVHPELAKVSRVRDHYRYQGSGMYSGQTTTPVSADDRDDWLTLPPAADLDESDASSGRFLAIYPNVLLSVLPNHVFVMMLEPLSAGQTRETCTFLLPPSTPALPEGGLDKTRRFWLDVNAEDIEICQRGQRGLHSARQPGPLAPRFEEPLHRFHNMLADCMTADDLSSGLQVPVGDDGSAASRWGTGPNPTPPGIDQATSPEAKRPDAKDTGR